MSTTTEEALRRLIRAYVRLLEAGRDLIIDHGGQCDPVDVMERSDPFLAEARATLAAASQASPAPVPDEQAGEWQWVPKEPTREMVSAGARCASSNMVYREMLAAAPSRPVAAEKREPLTPERILELRGKCIVDGDDTSVGFCRLIEAEHGIVGTHNATGGGA